MNTNRERIIDFIGVIKDFFGNSYNISDEEKSEKDLLEWKKANKISDKNIMDFEKMLNHNDKVIKRRNTGKMNLAKKSKTDNSISKTQILDFDKNVNNKENEQERGA